MNSLHAKFRDYRTIAHTFRYYDVAYKIVWSVQELLPIDVVRSQFVRWFDVEFKSYLDIIMQNETRKRLRATIKCNINVSNKVFITQMMHAVGCQLVKKRSDSWYTHELDMYSIADESRYYGQTLVLDYDTETKVLALKIQ